MAYRLPEAWVRTAEVDGEVRPWTRKRFVLPRIPMVPYLLHYKVLILQPCTGAGKASRGYLCMAYRCLAKHGYSSAESMVAGAAMDKKGFVLLIPIFPLLLHDTKGAHTTCAQGGLSKAS
jgi:hypothetical protein